MNEDQVCTSGNNWAGASVASWFRLDGISVDRVPQYGIQFLVLRPAHRLRRQLTGIDMAEFEQGYCTGCGYKVRRWGHRPYCWRKVTMMVDVDTRGPLIQKLLVEMLKHWRIRSLFLCKKKHMYYWPLDIESTVTDEQVQP